ncbi:uncharacterized protein HMPREF1541_06351 [Cyphellophora europaea CBS 101466]|uniref:Cep57 centrosome microtubule-binding domain-containing protein n=1 Tax=Cyphellophora europaea (strain CBS 101466) TaxID=1220924 RepID=W2RPB7_CYPE1|nr:uncharacterized protein HMPREF1541_06351 [Cyphellophora europaea CBS 101466]ETN38317.1 hypothetical protein HMPREF1541_06351 [Cyphellophora europaea CBS 101466]
MPDTAAFDRGTYQSNYSSLHSIDAYIGRQQVMYTPGSSPPVNRKKSGSRFKAKQTTVSQSFMMPSNIPNSSQILPERGTLRDVHVHYNIPPDEKQIVASLRALQDQLDRALVQIADLTKERDDAIHELSRMRESHKKRASFAKQSEEEEEHSTIEEELFDLSRVEGSPRMSLSRQHKSTARSANKTSTDNEARLISTVPAKRVASMSPEIEKRVGNHASTSRDHRASKKAMIQDTEESIVDNTAASNISRRRRPSLDDNMTSAYIIPDITLALKQQQQQQAQEKKRRASQPQLSEKAQSVLHDHDPQHIASCAVCQRLTGSKKSTRATSQPVPKTTTSAGKTGDYTAQVTALMKDIALDEPTARPKIPPAHALAHLKKLLNDQYHVAKLKHGEAWEKYDEIEAPKSSKKHNAVAEEMSYWSRKMEECRVNLDQLRDVEEGMRE